MLDFEGSEEDNKDEPTDEDEKLACNVDDDTDNRGI
jgi:hypothetical protein